MAVELLEAAIGHILGELTRVSEYFKYPDTLSDSKLLRDLDENTT